MLHVHHRKLIIIGLIFLASWLVGTVLMHQFEQGHPIGESYFNAFYFTVITTATIGFGDLVPMTVAGKIVTMLYAIFYVPLFLYVMTLLYQMNIEKLRAKDREHDKYILELQEEITEVEEDMVSLSKSQSHTDTKERSPIKKRKLIAKK